MPSSLLRLKALGITLLTVLLALGLTGQPAHADVHDFPDGYPKTASSSENEPGYLVRFAGTSLRPNLFKVLTGPSGEPLRAYCIESKVNYHQNHDLKMVGWDEFPGDNKFATDAGVRAKVAWIAQRSYPQTGLAELSTVSGIPGLTAKEAITATQAALWHLTDGLEYQSIDESVSPEVQNRVTALFNYLIGPANTGLTPGGGPTIEITGPADPGVAGEPVGPFKVKSSQATVQADIDPEYPLIDGDGNVVDTDAVPADTELYLDVPQTEPAGQAIIKVTVEGSRFAGNLLISREGRTQTIVVVRSEAVEADAEVLASWVAAPMPTPTPTPTPSTPDPTPSTSTNTPTPAPATSQSPKPGLPKTGN